jgi:zinc resistance-associated protein
MRKMVVALAVLVALGLVASPVLACWGDGYWGGPMGGPGGGYYPNANPGGSYKSFLNDTTKLRQDLAAKQGEYSALMARPNPDPKRAAKLSQEIFGIQDQLRAKAQNYDSSGWGRGPRGNYHGMHMGPYAGGYCW